MTFRTSGTAAHLDLGGERGEAIVTAMRDQLGLVVTQVEPFGLEGSGGSSAVADDPGGRVPGRSGRSTRPRTSVRTVGTGSAGRSSTDSWRTRHRSARFAVWSSSRTTPCGSCVTPTSGSRPYGIVELTPNAEYMLVTEFFEHAKTLGDSEVDEVVIDEGMVLIDGSGTWVSRIATSSRRTSW